MSRRSRLALLMAGGLAGLLLALGIAAVLIVHSAWFQDFVRRKMVETVEKATGGKSEVGSYSFDWKRLTARVSHFTLHGAEPAGSPPLFQAQSVTAGLKVISVFKKQVDLQSLVIEQPRIYLLIHPDGSTNIPSPKVKRSGKPALETLLDLAVRQFTVEKGELAINFERKLPFDLRGENLRASLAYQLLGPRYEGQVSMNPLYVQWAGRQAVPVATEVKLWIEKNRIQIEDARLALAKSTLRLSGALENLSHPGGQFRYSTRVDLNELGRILEAHSRQQGVVAVSGDGSFSGSSYSVAGKMHAAGVAYERGDLRLRQFRAEAGVDFKADVVHLSAMRLSGSVTVPIAKKRPDVQVEGRIESTTLALGPENLDARGVLLAALGGTFAGDAEVRKFQRLQAAGTVSDFDVQRVVSLYSAQTVPWDGHISGPIKLDALLTGHGALQATGELTVSPAGTGAPVHGRVQVSYDSQRDLLDLGNSWLALPSTTVRFSGAIDRELRVQLDSKNLDDILPAAGITALPLKLQNGEATFQGTVTGKLSEPQIAGHATAASFVYDGTPVDSFAADVSAAPGGVQLQKASLARGSLRAQFEGSVGLADWKAREDSPISAGVSLQNASVAELLAAAGEKDLPAGGTLNATARISGTIGRPQAAADLQVVKGQIDGEPFDRLDARAGYANNQVEVASAQLAAGARRIDLQATWQHAPGDLRNGRLAFRLSSNQMALEEFQTVVKQRPGLQGALQATASGTVALAKSAPGKPGFQISELQADVTARGLKLEEQPLGDLHLVAKTQGGELVANLDSDFANSAIHGEGRWRLAEDYPGSARISFSKVDLAQLREWISPAKSPRGVQIAGFLEGNATIAGPALKPEEWKASLAIPQIQVGPAPGSAAVPNHQAFTLRNAGPVEVTLANSVVRVVSAHFTGKNSDLTVGGTVSLKQRNPLELKLSARLDLGILGDFDRDLVASGLVTTDAEIRGSFSRPQVGGRLVLKDADLSLAGVPNGLSNANGVVVFSGTRGSIQNLTAESGGGKVTLSGFAGYEAGALVFRLQANAKEVRVRYPEGVSTVANAQLALTGTPDRSLLSGAITVLRTGFNPRTDVASILAKSAEPVRTPSAQAGFLSGMYFDVQIDTSPEISFQSSLAQNIQAEANLRLRGTALNPALLGRVNITQGQLVFFGTKFTIDQGSIAFYNPVKVDPILNVDLETQARGVDVILTVSGPLNKLNLTPRSDPPLQFSEIVALLATGNAPTSEPSLAAQQSSTPQTWQQIGASELLGQALANPVAGRIQRFFGVTKLRIDPTLTGVENNPQARITIEQQVTPDITFTYITNITNSNPQVVRVEWAVNKTWSVVAVREENGLTGLDFLYKKRFR